ncbi:MAG: PAS domain S-box protein, partial [Holophagaceae bacterium]|nr:PAS domain S-box protein [Holophagaceae bacterium]
MKVVSSSTGAGELFRRMAPAIFLAPLLLGWLTLAGEKSGLYRTEFEVSLMVVGSAVSLLGLLWMASDHLFHLEGKRRQVHQAMEASEEDLAITLQSIGDAVITTDPDGRVTRMNPVAERLTGWTLAEAKGLLLSQVFQIVSEDTREHLEDPASRVLREGVVVGLANHTLLLAKDGREISLSDSGAPIRGEDGKIRGVVLVFRDMTEERAAEEALRRSESSSRLLFEGNPLPMWVYDLETLAFLLVNDAAVANYGYSREEFLSMKIPDIRPQEDAQR